jgi:N4-gp56 family major capsid protein
MAQWDNIHKTTTSAISPSLIEYYWRKLEPRLTKNRVYARDAQTRQLPGHNGKTVNFRRYKNLPVNTTPLVEGVTPEALSMEMEEFSATIEQHGDYIETSDLSQWVMLDDQHMEAAVLLADQAAEKLDTIDRDALMLGLNVMWANNKTSRSGLVATDVLNSTEIRKAVRALKNANVKRFPDGFYHAIIHPYTWFDLQNDNMWQDVAKYQDKSKIETGEIGTLFDVKFFETTNPIMYNGPTSIIEGVATLTVAADSHWTAQNKTLVLSSTLTSDQAAALEDAVLNINGTTVAVASATATVTTPIAAAATLVLTTAPAAAITDAWAGKTIYPWGAGKDNIDVTATLIYGANSFGNVSLEGNGKNVEIIAKPLGHGEDPLNQRATVGWKAKGYTMTILNEVCLIRLEHGFSS